MHATIFGCFIFLGISDIEPKPPIFENFFLPLFFVEMDEMLNGFQPGELLILAARPSMGKTAFALNVMEQMALAGHGVAMFSLEMGKQQLVQRMLCARGRIDSQRLRKNMLQKEEKQILRKIKF